MKSVLTNLFYFVIFAIVFSALTGCTGSSAVTNTAGSAASETNARKTSGGSNQSTYPPLATSIADADMEFAGGKTEKLSQRKGNVVLVNFWAIWCGPCRAEMPHLVELQDKYRNQGFQIIGLNVGMDQEGTPETFEAMKSFGEKMKLNYELARSPQEMTNQVYRVANMNGIPISLLIDRDGHLRAVLRGGGQATIDQLKKSVDRAMAE